MREIGLGELFIVVGIATLCAVAMLAIIDHICFYGDRRNRP
jgi:hypothetical protein